jgi:hypothetical protein
MKFGNFVKSRFLPRKSEFSGKATKAKHAADIGLHSWEILEMHPFGPRDHVHSAALAARLKVVP